MSVQRSETLGRDIPIKNIEGLKMRSFHNFFFKNDGLLRNNLENKYKYIYSYYIRKVSNNPVFDKLMKKEEKNCSNI